MQTLPDAQRSAGNFVYIRYCGASARRPPRRGFGKRVSLPHPSSGRNLPRGSSKRPLQKRRKGTAPAFCGKAVWETGFSFGVATNASQVRAFADEEVVHSEGEVDPVKDLETISTELRLKDLERAKTLLEDVQKQQRCQKPDKAKKAQEEVLKTVAAMLEEGKWVLQGQSLFSLFRPRAFRRKTTHLPQRV